MVFEKAEYLERLRKTRERMSAEGIDVLLASDPANMNYLTGYDGWSFYVPQMVMVFMDKEEPIWIGREMDASGARITTWLDGSNILSYTDDYVQNPPKHPMDHIASVLGDLGAGTSVIGVEKDVYYFTALGYERLHAGLPGARFKDASLLVNWVRFIKSDNEIRYMKMAARLVEKAMATALEAIDEGIRGCDVVAGIYHAQISGTSEFGGEYTGFAPMLPSGEQTCTPHLTWSDREYKKGDVVILELAGCKHRYHSPMARTMVVGPAPAGVRDTAQVVVEGIEAALDAVKPGATCEDVERAWRHVIERQGLRKNSRLGYSIGIGYPPDWGEHTASLRQGDRTVLGPNMTFHMIAGIWLEDFGVEISEAIRVTEKGSETLASFPRDLLVK
jgi:Xaa-Pro dipeptidase